MSDVPRQIERRVESKAGVRDLDVKSIELEQSDDDGDTYRVVIDDPDAEEGENPAFFITKPAVDRGMNMFGDRLASYLNKVQEEVLGVERETQQELREVEEQLEERGVADDDDVEYGPGPRPNLDGIHGGYDDGDVRVESTTEADFSEAQEMASQGRESTADAGETRTSETSEESIEEPTTDDMDISTETIYGRIADTALDAQELDEKGHDVAVEALLEEIKGEIDEHLEDE